MNGRIRQLCQQKANYWMNHYDRKSLADMSLLYNDVEKFAELIVRECALTLYKTSMNNHESGFAHEARVMELAGDIIKQHFGVE